MKSIIKVIILSFIATKSFGYSLELTGFKKLSLNDLQSITTIDIINKSDFDEDELNSIIKELYQSNLIYDTSLDIVDDIATLQIVESKIIENIYVNNNVFLKDDDIINNLNSKINFFISKSEIDKDVKIIRKMYTTLGFADVSINVVSESFSEDRVNIIFEVSEGSPSNLAKINFFGNNYLSDRYLNKFISSEKKGFLDFFSSGSNLDSELFEFDKRKITALYKEKGFFDVQVSYELEKLKNNRYTLNFYISENNRSKIENIYYDVLSDQIKDKINILSDKFNKTLEKNDNYFDLKFVSDHLDDLNFLLLDKDISNSQFDYSLDKNNDNFNLKIFESTLEPIIVNKIEFTGNSITKEPVLRSKLDLQPGDYYSEKKVSIIKSKFNKAKYISNTKINSEIVNNQADIFIDIKEKERTGSFNFGGSFSGDTGFGLGVSIKDINILGTGNELNSTFNVNSEQALFLVNYIQTPLYNPNIKNNYDIFNSEKDLTDSYGYKLKEQGLGYAISYEYNEKVDITTGIKVSTSEGYSGKNSSTVITDNIGNKDNLKFTLSVSSDTTNDIFFPTDGIKNRIHFVYSPNDISDDPFYKMVLKSDIYNQFKSNSNFLFFSNRFGIADSLDGNLNTANVFGLGGLNFKGFDYRGIGPFNDNIYLGGNSYFTSTLGLGGSFLFDEKDNINLKLFTTTGSIWNSDYSSQDEFDLRNSVGLSFDIMTEVFPVSLSYAIPFNKKDADKTREFNFSIGSSF